MKMTLFGIYSQPLTRLQGFYYVHGMRYRELVKLKSLRSKFGFTYPNKRAYASDVEVIHDNVLQL